MAFQAKKGIRRAWLAAVRCRYEGINLVNIFYCLLERELKERSEVVAVFFTGHLDETAGKH